MGKRKSGAHEYSMAEFMPADGEEFEREDHQSYAGDGPQTEEHDRIDDYLSIRLEHTYRSREGERMGNPLRRAQATGRERKIQNGRTACISHLVVCGHDATVLWSDGWEPRV